MIKLFHVWRYHSDLSESCYLVSTFPTNQLAESFILQCERTHWTYKIQESHLSTYGMADLTRSELIGTVNRILAKGVK